MESDWLPTHLSCLGIDELQAVFVDLLSKRLHIPRPAEVIDIRQEVASVERPEPNCC